MQITERSQASLPVSQQHLPALWRNVRFEKSKIYLNLTFAINSTVFLAGS